MNCPFCNYPNDHNAPFCVNCGGALPAEKRPAQRPAQAPSPAAPQWTQQPQQPQAPQQAQQWQPQPVQPYAAQPVPQAPYAAQPPAADWQALYSQAQVQAPAPRKKSSVGCIIAAIIVGGLFIAAGILAVVVYLAYSNARSDAREAEKAKMIELQKMEQIKQELEKKAAAGNEKTKGGKTGPEGAPAGEAGINPRVKTVSMADLFQSQIFKQNDKIPYAGLTFSLKNDIRLYKPAMVPAGVNVRKGVWMADVQIQVEGKAKMKKFKLLLIDGSGEALKPDDSFEKRMILPERSGETHRLWKKVSKISKGSPVILHRGFSVAEKNAHSFLVEITNQNIDRALWIEAGQAMASK